MAAVAVALAVSFVSARSVSLVTCHKLPDDEAEDAPDHY